MSAGQTAASPAAIRVCSSSTPTQPPPSTTMKRVVFGLECGSIRAPRAKASSDTVPRPSLWSIWPDSPTEPIGPSGRRCRRRSGGSRWAFPAIPLSAAARWRRLVPAAGWALLDRGFRIDRTRPCVNSARAPSAPRRPQHRREAEEADPDDHTQATTSVDQHDEEIEDEERLMIDRLNVISPVHHTTPTSRGMVVAMEGTRPDVVEHGQDREQDRGRDPSRMEQYRGS